MAPAPPLPDLIASVEADSPAPDPLAHLATASATAAELTETSDSLVGHFVDRCRAAGHTWAEISESLGVSRQAAHKRYAGPPSFSHFTKRARRVYPASIDAARGLGHAYVGTEHLLLGLFPPGGIAATVLAESGLTERTVAAAVLARSPRGTVMGPAELPVTPRATEVFSGALREALSMGHNYIGTEHLVLALFRDAEGFASQILADAGATHAAYKARIVEILTA